MRQLFRRGLGGLVGLWAWVMVMPVHGMEADEILRQMDRKLHATSYESYARIAFEVPNGRVRTVTLYSARKSGRQALAVVVAPDDMKGRAVLRVGDGVWMHVPGELELRKSSLMVSMVGGVFNNADLLTGDFLEEYQPTLLGEEESAWRLELTPRFAGSPYARMELRVDKKNLTPVELAQFDGGGGRIKTIRYQDVQTMDGDHLHPMTMETVSGLNARYRSSWHLGQMTGRDFPAEAFTREFLPRAGRLMK
ncbi:MAG: outer membrane lipoprotein-sorting protein [Magnetococcales bacterium]|nr:outer membrane lipoprotein-sorting protein [Magnetococcales bacterium]